MSESRFWRLVACGVVAGLFYVGNGLNQRNSIAMPSMLPAAHAGVGVADESAETLYTASADGRKIYMWQNYGSKPPRFLGEADAILRK